VNDPVNGAVKLVNCVELLITPSVFILVLTPPVKCADPVSILIASFVGAVRDIPAPATASIVTELPPNVAVPPPDKPAPAVYETVFVVTTDAVFAQLLVPKNPTAFTIELVYVDADTFPTTCNLFAGLSVPIPTLPVEFFTYSLTLDPNCKE
jgi:hypothetical protein